MPPYFRAADGIVAEVMTPLEGFTLAETFPPDIAGQFADAADANPLPQVGDAANFSDGAWVFSTPVVPPPNLQQQAMAAMADGLTLALSGSVTLAATVFPTDPTTQGKLAAVVTTLIATGAFPGGVSSYPMKDATGAWHSFSETQYKTVAAAIATYAAALDLIIDGNPTNATSLPASSASLTI